MNRSINDVRNPASVLSAVEEFDRLGRTEFLKRHHFGPARSYCLLLNGRSYDSKAIMGVAYGHEFPVQGPLRSAEFTGGENTVKRRLEELGFVVALLGSSPHDAAVELRRIETAKADDAGAFATRGVERSRPDTRHRRDASEWLVAYFLARCGVGDASRGHQRPPAAIGVRTHAEAFDLFFDALSRGRDRQRFRNSLKNARDAFDAHIPSSGRIGWRASDPARSPQILPAVAREVFDAWRSRTDDELAEQVLALSANRPASAELVERLRIGGIDIVGGTAKQDEIGRAAAADTEFGRNNAARQRRRSERAKLIGDRGEEIVRVYLETLAEIVTDSIEHLSPQGLTPGYDLRCRTHDGSTIAIEVKATTSSMMTSFELTENERSAAVDTYAGYDKYWILLVTNAMSASPIVHHMEEFAALLKQRELALAPLSWVVSGFKTTADPSASSM